MNNALVPVNDIEKMAGAVAKSGLFGIKTADQAMALMLIAQAEGLHPAIAARDYHIIQGKPSLKADAMLARFQTAGGKLQWKSYTDTECCAVVSHPQGGSIEVKWTIDMAKKAGLTGNQTWTKYPRQMLRARVISEGIRTVYPGVAVGVYTPEEVEDFDNKPMKDVTPEVKAEAPKISDIADKTRSIFKTAKLRTEWREMVNNHFKGCGSKAELEGAYEKYSDKIAEMKANDNLYDLQTIEEIRAVYSVCLNSFDAEEQAEDDVVAASYGHGFASIKDEPASYAATEMPVEYQASGTRKLFSKGA